MGRQRRRLGQQFEHLALRAEGYQEEYVAFVKQVTTKPVVAVGRYTSPDAMVARPPGIVDLIGAARPSIADPFLPRKIEEGRLEDIRECIGCNVCVRRLDVGAVRCTQNPTLGEEWRTAGIPSASPPRPDAQVLIVGAGPGRAGGGAGARPARLRGHAGRGDERARRARHPREQAAGAVRLGARARLPASARSRRWPNVEVFLASRLTADEVLEFGADHVAIATGAPWRRDGSAALTSSARATGRRCLTPDDILAGAPSGRERGRGLRRRPLLHGGVIAELLAGEGREVTLVTPAAQVSEWTVNTMEQVRIHRRLLECGVTLETGHALVGALAPVSSASPARSPGGSASCPATRSSSSPRGCRGTGWPRSCMPAPESGRLRAFAPSVPSATRGRRAPSRAPSGTGAATRRSSTPSRPATRCRSGARSSRSCRRRPGAEERAEMEHAKEIEIRWRDLDGLGHVNHAVFLTYLEEARDEWLERLLDPPGGVWSYVVARVEIDYRRELRLDDEVVVARCGLDRIGTSSVRTRESLITRAGETVAEAVVVLVARDEQTGRSRPLTGAERAAFERAAR